MTILEKIEENARLNPNRLAYYTETAGGEVKLSLTWHELNYNSSCLAAYLSRTLQTKRPLIVYGHKHPYMLVCFLACAKSGRAYCPIDISVPQSRVQAIVEEVKPEQILATEEWGLPYENVLPLASLESIIQSESHTIEKEKYVSAEDVFYIIFTSGSTGIPKGVQITRDCLDHFVDWATKLGSGLPENAVCTYINQAPFSFDLSVMDVYLSLYMGGTIWALSKETQCDMKNLLQSLENSESDIWVSTPSFAELCLSDKKFSEALMPKLKRFLFCGETLSNGTVLRLQKAFPKAEIINTYGPTESTVAVTQILVDAEVQKRWSPLPVGKEKPGTWIFIMDENGKELPEGEKGEIVIVGDTVSIGYWNNREMTEKAFGTYLIDGKEYRLYRTGDKGYKKEGLLFYCGRLDLQIKLHGYRIELEDIESNIRRLPKVSQAAVLPVYQGGQVKYLTAFLAMKGQVTDAFTKGQAIRESLKEYLPDYMIPRKIKFLETLPMTNNGKVDRRALEEMEK